MTDLIEQLTALTGPDREMDAMIYDVITPKPVAIEGFANPYRAVEGPTVVNYWEYGKGKLGQCTISNLPQYTSSVDAALTLVPSDAAMSMDRMKSGYEFFFSTDYVAVMGQAPTLPLAICIASLEARIVELEKI